MLIILQVYLLALEGHVPLEIIAAFSAFLDFCYLVRQDSTNDNTLLLIQESLDRFYQCRAIFQVLGVRPGTWVLPAATTLPFPLPRAHTHVWRTQRSLFFHY